MAAVTVRDLDDAVRDRLRVRAANNGRSMEAEIRSILTASVAADPAVNPFVVLMDRFAELGGVDLDIPPRDSPARAAGFEE